MLEKIIEKFWSNVDQTKCCWNWTGPLEKSGLPVIRYFEGKFKECSPRRVSLEISGKIISSTDRAQPLICKNKLCVNPHHLVIGDEARFWAKVQKLNNDCWIWTASQDKDMYGKFRIYELGKKIDIRAHVYSWQLYTGRPVPTGSQVCHKCDHPYCVNPHHLFLGTTQDNTKDRDEKGRQAKGEKQGSSKLTEEKVKEIRELHKRGISIKQLSSQFQLSWTTIAYAINGKTWRHVL